jgi:hypothetical protein
MNFTTKWMRVTYRSLSARLRLSFELIRNRMRSGPDDNSRQN